MINSYMGRQKFYMQCLEKNDFSTLKIHIIKNVYRNVDNSDYFPQLLTNYCQLCFKVLEEIQRIIFSQINLNFLNINKM